MRVAPQEQDQLARALAVVDERAHASRDRAGLGAPKRLGVALIVRHHGQAQQLGVRASHRRAHGRQPVALGLEAQRPRRRRLARTEGAREQRVAERHHARRRAERAPQHDLTGAGSPHRRGALGEHGDIGATKLVDRLLAIADDEATRIAGPRRADRDELGLHEARVLEKLVDEDRAVTSAFRARDLCTIAQQIAARQHQEVAVVDAILAALPVAVAPLPRVVDELLQARRERRGVAAATNAIFERVLRCIEALTRSADRLPTVLVRAQRLQLGARRFDRETTRLSFAGELLPDRVDRQPTRLAPRAHRIFERAVAEHRVAQALERDASLFGELLGGIGGAHAGGAATFFRAPRTQVRATAPTSPAPGNWLEGVDLDEPRSDRIGLERRQDGRARRVGGACLPRRPRRAA